MPEKKLNRRVQYTRNALRNALIDLAGEKPLRNITVTDICARADINRSTFYLHYKDVYSLLHEIEEEILAQMRDNMSDLPFQSDLLAIMLQNVKNNLRIIPLLKTLMGEEGDPQFVRKLEKITYQAFQRGWELRLSHIDTRYKKLIYSYMVGGMVAAMATWTNDTACELSAADAISLLHNLMDHGIASLLPPDNSISKN